MVQMRLMVETTGAAENRWRNFLEFILDSAVEKGVSLLTLICFFR